MRGKVLRNARYFQVDGRGGKHDLRFREIGRVGTTPGFNILLGNHNETPRR